MSKEKENKGKIELNPTPKIILPPVKQGNSKIPTYRNPPPPPPPKKKS